jgi:hypothetical protein
MTVWPPASTLPAWVRCAIHSLHAGYHWQQVSKHSMTAGHWLPVTACSRELSTAPRWQPDLLTEVGTCAVGTPLQLVISSVRAVQEALSFCEDSEDVVSLAMSALQALMLKHGVDPSRVGRCGSLASSLLPFVRVERTAQSDKLSVGVHNECVLTQAGVL